LEFFNGRITEKGSDHKKIRLDLVIIRIFVMDGILLLQTGSHAPETKRSRFSFTVRVLNAGVFSKQCSDERTNERTNDHDRVIVVVTATDES
jgi:hypothetical protein